MSQVSRKVGRPIEKPSSAHAKLAELKLKAADAATELKAYEAEIRAGLHDYAFTLVEPKEKFFVPAPIWKEYVGKDWYDANKQPQNQQLVIVPINV